jgi:hypothetical protein
MHGGIFILNSKRHITMVIIISIFLFTTTFTLILIVANAQEEEHDEPPITNESGSVHLLTSEGKIAFIKYVDFLNPNEEMPTFPILLINSGDQPATEIRIIHSALTIREKPLLSFAPSYIARDKIRVEPNEQAQVTKDNDVEINFKLEELVTNEASYEGRLLVIGGNIEPITIDVEITFKDNPWIYFIFALVGVAMAVIFGYLYARWEQAKEIKSRIDDDAAIISHINGHIRNLNLFRNTINKEAWKNIFQGYKEKWKAIVKYRNRLELDTDAEAVLWFEQVDDLVRERNLLEKPIASDNKELEEIDKPEIDDPYYQARKKRKIREELKSNITERSKWIYLIVTSVISSFAALLASATFAGNTYLNIIIAISIGFAVYRAQDALKAFTTEKKEAPEETAEPPKSHQNDHHHHDHKGVTRTHIQQEGNNGNDHDHTH